MRIDKYISQNTDFSRNEVKKQLKAGRITVNTKEIVNANYQVNDGDLVTLDHEIIQPPGMRYFMLHKPAGVISATKDSQLPTALDLLDEPRSQQLTIAGRLDLDATGLLLLTDDGQWNHRVTSPNYQCEKTYYVETADPISETIIDSFTKGIWLANEKRRTRPANLVIINKNEAELTLSEGKYHQVKRMFAATGNLVIRLHRIRIGQVILDNGLLEGEYRPLTPDEINSF